MNLRDLTKAALMGGFGTAVIGGVVLVLVLILGPAVTAYLWWAGTIPFDLAVIILLIFAVYGGVA